MAKLDGSKELKNNLKKINKSSTNQIEQALTKSALIVERDAKVNAPVDTGRLRSSISHKEEGYGSESPYVEVGTNVEYAKSVEFGTSRQSAQPFLFPAFNNNKDKILKELANAMRKGVGL